MVEMLASRRAGKSLLSIIAVLLLPIVVLSTLYLRQALKDIRFLGREIVGIEIAELAYGALVSDRYDISIADRTRLAALEARLGLVGRDGFEAHLKHARAVVDLPFAPLSSQPNESAQKTEPSTDALGHLIDSALAGYITEVGDQSGLVRDSESVSYQLAYAYVVQLPQLVNAHEQLVLKLSGKSKTSSMGFSVSESQQRLGRLQTHVQALQTAITSARSKTDEALDFSAQTTSLSKLAENTHRIGMVLGQLTFLGTKVSAADQKALAVGLARTRLEAKVMADGGLTMLRDRLASRRVGLIREFLALGAVGLACSIAAMALAVFMFRRTLTKLDEIEAMRDAADFSRTETERINGDVALLNRELSDKIQKLAAAQNDIVRKGRMEQLGQLTATVAHELRNPLGAVRTSAYLIGKKIDGKGVGIETQLERINSGITRCDSIITQLLDYSRTKKITPQLADLDEWLAELVNAEAVKLPTHIIVDCTLGLGGAHVPFDGARLERAVINLIANAAEAFATAGQTGQGSRTPTLWISTQRRGSDAIIRVKDNGPGIAAENLQRIREPLFTTKNFGTGLGLPAIEQIAEQHNGRLEIESLLGEGACFDLVIPMKAVAAA